MVAPDLSFEGLLLKDDQWLLDHFKNPRNRIPDSIMPGFRFNEADFQAMTAYLATLKTPPSPSSPGETYKTFCARCHGEKGDGHGPIATYMDPAPRDLTKAAFFLSKPRDVFAQLIKEGVHGNLHGVVGKVFNDAQVNGLVDYVMTTYVKEKPRDLKAGTCPSRIRCQPPKSRSLAAR